MLTQELNEQAIRIASQMYEARDSVRFLLGDAYKERMAEGGKNLQAIADEHKISVLEAARRCAKMYADRHEDMATLLVLAAAVEHLEPSE